jgi:S-adenosylmethionine:tRNA ribosyltransferase-isomerase
MKTADYDFHLPEELIAYRPAEKRDGSRLLVVHRDGRIEHRHFFDLPEFLDPGDMLLMNNSRVFPARLTGYKPTGGRIEILLVRELSPGLWQIMSRERYTGTLKISDGLSADISEGKTAHFKERIDLMARIWQDGEMPLPPYIKRRPDSSDKERYQTVYAEKEGSIAAPTAGLHFTHELISRLTGKSVLIRSVTLHVGIGTFRPVKAAELKDHTMESEFFEISPDLITEIEDLKKRGNRLIAVGTTATRTIEGYLGGRCSVSSSNGTISGSTDIFIHEGFRPKAVDSLITNFHLPRSTPLMLASVFAGREKLLETYASAISLGYRFFSYGDAMLVL